MPHGPAAAVVCRGSAAWRDVARCGVAQVCAGVWAGVWAERRPEGRRKADGPRVVHLAGLREGAREDAEGRAVGARHGRRVGASRRGHCTPHHLLDAARE
eukprot:142008-Chlamydomonas_euryale.AAC.1